MSVLSENRQIDVETLRHFIPADPDSTQLIPINTGGTHSYESEREILYKILYELRGNVSDLRRDMNSLRKQLDDAQTINAKVAEISQQLPAISTPATHRVEEAEAEEISETETLNLSDLGRQMVMKALERNGGNRKRAALELGISDRTLYRKLKQYGLDKKED